MLEAEEAAKNGGTSNSKAEWKATPASVQILSSSFICQQFCLCIRSGVGIVASMECFCFEYRTAGWGLGRATLHLSGTTFRGDERSCLSEGHQSRERSGAPA